MVVVAVAVDVATGDVGVNGGGEGLDSKRFFIF